MLNFAKAEFYFKFCGLAPYFCVDGYAIYPLNIVQKQAKINKQNIFVETIFG